MTRLIGIGGAMIVTLSAPAAPWAQAEPRPRVHGVVRDSSGAAVQGAVVTIRREADSYLASVLSGPDGRFEVEVQAGELEVVARAEGFSAGRTTVRVSEGGPVDVCLTLRAGVFTEEVTVVGTRLAGSAATLGRLPGSVDLLDSDQIQTSRVANVGETLRKATGINIRDEEGFALRPNIGIRGLNPTRSTKALLLEDGLFVTYAPYGDNATYYHPPVERFESIEVVKGAGQIAYGPVTVGGVINYLTPPPPVRPTANLRLAGGNRGYFNGQTFAGGTWGRTAVLAEYMYKQGDGSRDNVHTRVDDANLKAVLTLSARQTLTFKGNYYGEDSQVTYSGLTLAEWEADPRQNPFVNDGFDGWRVGASLKHSWLAGTQTLLTTHVYGSAFSRDWWRQSSNSSQRPNDRSDPLCGGMANLLTTCGDEGRLRDYDHFGVEPRLRTALHLLGLRSEAEAGVRLHLEVQERLQVNGDAPTARVGTVVENNRRENQAYSAFVQDRLLMGPFTLSAGIRFESIDYERANRLANDGAGARGRTSLNQWVPGVGLAWSPNETLTLFGGVHRGFAPPRTEDIIASTGGVVDLDAEKSWNVELGARGLPWPGLRLEATVFRNDYQNQIIPASLAGGVGAMLTNAGATLHEGLEIGARLDSATMTGSKHNVFLRGALTLLPTARFEGMRSSSVPGFSAVSVSGNRLPYAPETLLTAALGYRHPRGLTAQVEAAYVSDQYGDDLNAVAASADGQRGLIPGFTVWNLALSCDLRRVTLFVTVKNLLDDLYLADRSRGMIPGPPRLLQVGLVTRF